MSTESHAGFHDLATMVYYLDTKVQKISDLVKEIGEIQHEFEARFVQSQQRYENARAAAGEWVTGQGWKQPAWLAQEIEQGFPPMRDRKRARVAELEGQIAELETQRAEIERQNDETVAKVKTENPQLNAREEELKLQQREARKRVEALTEQWRKTAGGIGWLLRPGAVARARAALEAGAAEAADVNARLTEVRNTWVGLKQKTDETETTLQQAWRLRVAEIARLKRELSELQRDLDAAAREAVVEEALAAVTEPIQSDQPDFDKLLSEVVAAHGENNQYEAGIGQVAELIGMLKGLAEGLTRMGESVKGVQAEQEQHSELATLKLKTPDVVLHFHQLWDQLKPLVLDEKAAAAHPSNFAATVKQALGDTLSDQAIDAMFTALGDELNRATKEQWG